MSGTTCIFPNKYDLTSSKSILGNFYKFNKALNTFLKKIKVSTCTPTKKEALQKKHTRSGWKHTLVNVVLQNQMRAYNVKLQSAVQLHLITKCQRLRAPGDSNLKDHHLTWKTLNKQYQWVNAKSVFIKKKILHIIMNIVSQIFASKIFVLYDSVFGMLKTCICRLKYFEIKSQK